MGIKILTSDGIKYLTSKIKAWVTDGFVAKVNGKGLSTNDYTTDEKNKLAGIATGANKTVVDGELADSVNPVQNRVVRSALEGKQDTITAGTGLAIDGTTIKHSNSVTAQTSYVGSATSVPRFKFDAQGHITGVSTATIYPPTTVGSAGQVWVSDGSGAGAWKTLVTISTTEPTSSDGNDGDLWFIYE